MFRILKPSQVKALKDPFSVDNGQKVEKPKEPDIDPNEDAFASEAFQILSGEELAGGQKISTKKPAPQAPEQAESEASEASAVPEAPKKNEEDSFLSQAARKSRHAAVLEKLRIKELELEALEEELKEWEARLQQQENELVKKEQELSKANIEKRQQVEAECQQTLKMAKEAAESVKAAAKTEAETIKKQAKIEVDSVRETAYKEGFDSGEEKGLAQGEAEGLKEIEIDWKNMMNESEMIINELQSSRMGLLKASEEEMLRLVISFAKTILKVEPTVNQEIILKNIDEALNNIVDVDKIVMRINLRDKAMCEAHKERLLSRLGNISELRIVEDPSLSAGGVKIETGVGTIDATLETQARALERALLNKFESSQNG
mgnify:CR=1 FL=1